MRASLLLACAVACGVSAWGQSAEISLSGGVARYSGGSPGTVDATPGSPAIKVNGGFRLDARLTLNNYRFFAHEIGYGYSRSTYDLGSGDKVAVPVHQGGYNFLAYATPEGIKVRPFITGGAGFASFFPPGASVYYGNQITKFGINYGGGIKVKVSPILGIRVDVRQYLLPHPFDFPGQTGRLMQTAVTAGMSFNF
jgi:hypothetical protein